MKFIFHCHILYSLRCFCFIYELFFFNFFHCHVLYSLRWLFFFYYFESVEIVHPNHFWTIYVLFRLFHLVSHLIWHQHCFFMLLIVCKWFFMFIFWKFLNEEDFVWLRCPKHIGGYFIKKYLWYIACIKFINVDCDKLNIERKRNGFFQRSGNKVSKVMFYLQVYIIKIDSKVCSHWIYWFYQAFK